MAPGPVSEQAASGAATDPGALDALSEAIESGAGLPAVARAAGRALGASVALIDRSSAVLAVAASSSAEESRLLSVGEGVDRLELRVADEVVGELRYRVRGGEVSSVAARMVTTLLALELERSRAPDWASDEAAGEFVRAVLQREVTDRADLLARAEELGAKLDDGGGVLIARARPQSAQTEDWRSRVLVVALRALRGAAPGSIAALAEGGDSAEVAAIVPVDEDARLERAAGALARELGASLPGFFIAVARSRRVGDPTDLYRAGKEALLAANVAEAEGLDTLAFEDTGSYRLLLPAMSEDPSELERFYDETVAPIAAYDDQYETDLVSTIETYLENDGNVTPTAESMFTHRHTIRYRLERVRDLTGHDISSTEGREKLGLGLKAMRVLGIAPPRGPASEPGVRAGRARGKGKRDGDG